jgi:four helix bundle protein
MNDSRKWYFDFERFDAFRHALRAAEFVASRRRKLVGLRGKAGEQLERATAGAVTNLGAGSSAQGAEQKRHFRIALSEASEAGAALELARIYGAFGAEEYGELREILLRACACLRGLCR